MLCCFPFGTAKISICNSHFQIFCKKFYIFLIFFVMGVNFMGIKISNGIVVGDDEVYGDILYII